MRASEPDDHPSTENIQLNSELYKYVTVVGDSALQRGNIKAGVNLFAVMDDDASPCTSDGQENWNAQVLQISECDWEDIVTCSGRNLACAARGKSSGVYWSGINKGILDFDATFAKLCRDFGRVVCRGILPKMRQRAPKNASHAFMIEARNIAF